MMPSPLRRVAAVRTVGAQVRFCMQIEETDASASTSRESSHAAIQCQIFDSDKTRRIRLSDGID